jgi:protein-arginine kinase activator protein McsA
MKKIGQVRDFLKNMYKAAAGLAKGELQILDAREKAKRLKICSECPHFNHEAYQCKICSCKGRMMELKASVNLWNCPKGKWPSGHKTVPVEHGYCAECKGAIEKITKKGRKTFAECVNGCNLTIDER